MKILGFGGKSVGCTALIKVSHRCYNHGSGEIKGSPSPVHKCCAILSRRRPNIFKNARALQDCNCPYIWLEKAWLFDAGKELKGGRLVSLYTQELRLELSKLQLQRASNLSLSLLIYIRYESYHDVGQRRRIYSKPIKWKWQHMISCNPLFATRRSRAVSEVHGPRGH